MSLMRDRQFYVEDSGYSSEHQHQKSGITQGCTLRPLLFIVVMSVLMHDAVGMLGPEAHASYRNGTLADITFADDTLLLGVSPKILTEFLQCVASAGMRYRMELHYGKLHLLGVQSATSIPMPNGQPLLPEDSIMYLGTSLSKDGRLGTELGRRIGCAKADFKALCKVWRHSSLTRRRKLEIYASLIETKLLYGLSCSCLTVAEQRRVDGFQARCLRQVLGIQSAFLSRVSNKSVLSRARHVSATELIANQQLMMLGKVLRSPLDSMMHKSALVPGTLTSATAFYIRRRGRPRKEWVPTVLHTAHQRNNTALDLKKIAQDTWTWRNVMKR